MALKICFMCDLHLPFDVNVLQHDVLDWAIADIRRKSPDCVIFAGDATCDGNAETFRSFLQKMQSLGIPFLFVPGNSDLRCPENRSELQKTASCCENNISGTRIFAVNDCTGEISDEQLSIIENADNNSIVFMHHPPSPKLQQWRERHKETVLFHGHLHEAKVEGADISLQAMDPDKAIGECPCITYYETATKAHYFSPVPKDFYKHLGLSCYRTVEHILFCMENGLKNLELRPNCIYCDQDELAERIAEWRKDGGENLSIHLPDVEYNDGNITASNIDRFIELANFLQADRFTQHVPCVSVDIVKADPGVLGQICDYLTEKLGAVDHEMVIGVENMHMTTNEKPDDTRRFGYLPEECLTFMRALGKRCKHKVGINFDIGHARNNFPFSQKYPISTWLSQIGKYAVGYHIHQVTQTDEKLHNHMPITNIYGKLISYASFFKCWSNGSLNKAPVIFEMTPEGAYDITSKTFHKQKARNVCDMHTHTYYSNCGKDNPRDLINKALEQGISVLGISDHNYGIGERKAEYLKEIRTLAEEYKDRIKLLCGIEIATMPIYYITENEQEITNCDYRQYDYCLIEQLTHPESIIGGDWFAFCKKLGISCGVAHTDLFAYCDMYGYDYQSFFQKMAENNIF